MQLIATWNYPTSIRFGAGRIKELGAAAKAAGMARPLLVSRLWKAGSAAERDHEAV